MKAKTIKCTELTALINRDEYGGFGYLGHEFRGHASDVNLVKAANEMGLGIEDLFLWANSRYARHFMDQERVSVRAFKQIMTSELPRLREEFNAG